MTKRPSKVPRVKLSRPVNDSLGELARQANRWHQAYGRRQAQALLAARYAGETLLRIQGIVGHGSYKSWLKDNFNGSYSTANRYKNVAQHWADIEPHLKNGLCSVVAAGKILTEIKRANRPSPRVLGARDPGCFDSGDFLQRIKAVMPGVRKESTNRETRFAQSDKIVFQNGRMWTFDDSIACSIPIPQGMDLDINGAANGHALCRAMSACEGATVEAFVLRGDLLIEGENGSYGRFQLGSVDIYRMSMTKAASQTKPAKFLVVFS